MKQQKYDIFISYRRKTGVDDARLLQQSLKARGYNVFFDYDSLRDGKFDERIYAAIEEAPIFILMLSEGSLDTCYKEDDWVRIEIEYAIKQKCKIIPVAINPSTWTFPESLPVEIFKEIKNEQISELNKAALFEESIEKIIKDRLSLFIHKKNFGVRIFGKFSIVSCVFIGLILCCYLLMYTYHEPDIDLESIESWPCESDNPNDKMQLRLKISELALLEEEERSLQDLEAQIKDMVNTAEEKLCEIDKEVEVEIKNSKPIFQLLALP